ncbi:DUF3087 domain-containing protein [Halopseudomonas nanhaiensis]|nr:DUF3087 family protein [Halopseudomonas nanhaiensis]UAX00074.1 DUF3087 domain-containing protein [Halopseudomonas nanhaiensis]
MRHADPERYRRETRKSTLIVAVSFAVLAMCFSALAVALFGSPESDNFRWNLTGVALGLIAAVILVRTVFWSQPWMESAAYGWRLKRSLMRITDIMHHVESGVKTRSPEAMKLLRFYHLGQIEMHRLDGNTQALHDMSGEMEKHREAMQEDGLDTNQYRLDPAWLDHRKWKGFELR